MIAYFQHTQTSSDGSARLGHDKLPIMASSQRQSIVRHLWLQRPENRRTDTDVLIFHGELVEHHPELIKRRHGDSYQYLKVDLKGLIRP
jgi:hypothetical protein